MILRSLECDPKKKMFYGYSSHIRYTETKKALSVSQMNKIDDDIRQWCREHPKQRLQILDVNPDTTDLQESHYGILTKSFQHHNDYCTVGAIQNGLIYLDIPENIFTILEQVEMEYPELAKLKMFPLSKMISHFPNCAFEKVPHPIVKSGGQQIAWLFQLPSGIFSS